MTLERTPWHDAAGFVERNEEEQAAMVERARATNRARATEAFSEASFPVEITAEEREVGVQTYRYFMQRLKRAVPWLIKDDRIEVTKKTLAPGPLEQNPTDLLVVGSRGLSAARRLLLGSVSTALVNHAPCPVLVVRPPVTKPPGPTR